MRDDKASKEATFKDMLVGAKLLGESLAENGVDSDDIREECGHQHDEEREGHHQCGWLA